MTAPLPAENTDANMALDSIAARLARCESAAEWGHEIDVVRQILRRAETAEQAVERAHRLMQDLHYAQARAVLDAALSSQGSGE